MNDRTNVENICIWGAGLVGYSLARAFAGVGRRCLLIDVAPEMVERINLMWVGSGEIQRENFNSWHHGFRLTVVCFRGYRTVPVELEGNKDKIIGQAKEFLARACD